jgi:hypothetical protein
MKASALRIGNYLFVPGIGRKVIVSAIFKSHFVCEDKDGIRFEESIRINYQPIPLTEEWLLKFGFENWDKNKWIDSNSVLSISKNEDNFLCFFNQRHIDIFYVHQLQNLYFAITGEELTIKVFNL